MILIAEEILNTIIRLRRRIEERFPGSGLGGVCARLEEIGRAASARSIWISRPIISLRITSIVLVFLIIAALAGALLSARMPGQNPGIFEIIQGLEAAINDAVLIFAGIYFLVSIENRIKRRRALAALHELRSVAHIIDMHQLTKDPDSVLGKATPTASSPDRNLSRQNLGRYLDYCAEMLSLIGKIGAIYAQHFQDSVAIASVNEIEELTSGLSRKIWQKMMILHQTSAHNKD